MTRFWQIFFAFAFVLNSIGESLRGLVGSSPREPSVLLFACSLIGVFGGLYFAYQAYKADSAS